MRGKPWSWMSRSLCGFAVISLTIAAMAGCQGPYVAGEPSSTTTSEARPVIGNWGSEQVWTVATPTILHRWQGVPAGVEVIMDQEFKRVGEQALAILSPCGQHRAYKARMLPDGSPC